MKPTDVVYIDTPVYLKHREKLERVMPLWIPEWVVTLAGRTTCRLLRWHNVTCRGRGDHIIPGVGLIDPDRWNGWPRR